MKYIPGWFFLGTLVILGSRLNRGSADLLDRECGLSPIGNRIAGGRAAIENSTPWMTFVHNHTHFICGGSLISKAHVLTAAHCVSPTPKLLLARLGEYDWGPQKPCLRRLGCIASERDYNVSTIYRHPFYKTREKDDIAILKLEHEVTYTDRTTCRNKHNYPVDDTHICAGDPQQYVCSGDSGSPLGVMVPSKGTDYYIQLGIVSNGKLPCRGVAVFTNVLSYSDWIASVIARTPPMARKNFVNSNRRSSSASRRRTRLNNSGYIVE